MAVKMIKHNGKFVPAKLVDGKYVPDENKVLKYTAEGTLEVVDKKDNS